MFFSLVNLKSAWPSYMVEEAEGKNFWLQMQQLYS